MNLKKRLGKRIQELRLQKGLKQSGLAELVGIAAKTQSFIETGRTYPSSNLIEKYAKVFDADVADVLYLSDMPREEDDYYYALHKLLNNATKKQIEHVYKHAKLVMEF